MTSPSDFRSSLIDDGPLRGRVDVIRKMGRHGTLAVASAATLVLMIPILLEKPSVLRGGDIGAHAQFTLGLLESLRHGDPFPRWMAEVNYGFGGPIFIFYPPLAYYLTALTTWLAAGKAVLGFNLAFAVAGMASAFTFYRACRGLISTRGALCGAFLYAAAPYHAWELHAGYYAEYVAYAWLPMIWLFARCLIDEPTPGSVAGLGLWSAVLALTHLPTVVTAATTLVPCIAIRMILLRQRGRLWKSLAAFAAAGGIAFLCGAGFLLPMLLEQGRIDIGYVTEASFGNYRQWLIVPGRFHLLEWTDAFTGALLLTGVALYALAIVFLLPSQRESDVSPTGSGRAEAIAMSSLIVWALLLQLAPSIPVWELIPQLRLIQFPWRFNSPHALGCCMVVGLALSTRAPSTASVLRARVLITGILALPAIAHALSARTLPSYQFDQHALETDVHVKNRKSPEFVPRPVPRDLSLQGAGGGLLPPALWSQEGGPVEVRQWSQEYRELMVSTPRTSRLEIRTFFYPGWVARLDGKVVPLDRPVGPLYLLAVVIPPGENQRLELVFESTPLQTGAAALSASGLLVVALILLAERRRAASPQTPQP